MGRRAASHPQKEALMSHLPQPSHKHGLTGLTFQGWDMDQGSEEDPAFLRLLHQECSPMNMELKGGSSRRTTSCQADACISLQSPCIMP